MKKIYSNKKILSFILVCALVLSNTSFSVIALETDGLSSNGSIEEATINTVVPQGYREDTIESISEEELKTVAVGEKTLTELKQMTVDVDSLPVFINSNTAVQKGHVNRLDEQENDLNTVIFQNKDGSKTTYIFKNPVKYIDDNGDIRDKNTNISVFNGRDYKYAATDNIIKTYFPNQSNDGVKIDFHHFSIVTSPVSDKVATPIKIDDNTIRYDNVFGDNTSIVYYTEINGVKEDIVLYKYTENNEFQFELNVANLVPFESNGIWYLKNSQQKIVGSFGRIIVRDNGGNTTEGTMDIVPSAEKGKYLITIAVSKDFLTSESTIYPVCIDPSTYILEDGTYYYIDENGYEHYVYYNAIEDTGLYSAQSGVTNALHNQDYHRLGRYNSVDGKIVYKLYDFYGQYGQYKYLKPSQIGSVHLCINVNSGAGATLSVNPMVNTWDTSIVGDNPIAIYDSTLWSAYSTNNVSSYSLPSSAGEYSIDITQIVRGWARFNSGESSDIYNNPSLGFVLSSNSTSSRNVTSVEEFYVDSVYIIMDTSSIGGDYYVNNVSSGQFLRKNGTTALTTSLYANTPDIQWQFEYIGEDNYYIRSSSATNYVLYGSGSTVKLSSLPSSNPSNYYVWNVTIASGGGMIIKNVGNGYVLRYNGTALSLVSPVDSNSSTYEQTVWGIVAKDKYINLTDFEMSDNWLLPNSYKYFYVRSDATWSSNSCFTWSIVSNGTVTKHIFTVQPNGRIYASQYGGTATLTLTHKMTGLSKSFTIKSGEFRDGVYMIMNKSTGRYMDIEGPSTASEAIIQQWDYHTGNQAKWEIEMLGSGFYIIKSVYSSKWLKAGSSSDSNAIVQYSTYGTPSAKWYITKTSSGNYKITPTNNESAAISVPLNSNSNGTDLVLTTYSADSNYRDEWVFDNVGETYGITNGDVYTIEASHSNMVVTAESGGTASGTNVSQHTRLLGNQSQRWKFLYIGNGEYKIKDVNSGKLLSISANSSSNEANAQLLTDNGGAGQIFKIDENADGTYSFYTKCSFYSYALSVEDGSTSEDANIFQSSPSSANHTKFNIIDSNNAIIIVPGFGGSVLQMGTNFPSQDQYVNKGVWSMSRINLIAQATDEIADDINDLLTVLENTECIFDIDTILDEYLPQLEPESVEAFTSAVIMLHLTCNSSGNSNYDIKPKPYDAYESDTSLDKYGFNNTYDDLFINMKNITSSTGPYANYDVTLFSYDFRLSCADSAAELDAFIEQNEYDDVVLVCHSLGGLVGSGYMARGSSQLNKVEKYISLGTPHLGTVAVPTMCLVGDLGIFFGNLSEGEASIGEMILQDLCRDVVVQYILSNLPSVYEAMPTDRYVNATGGYLSYDEGELCTTYSETKNVIASHMKGYKASLMTSAENFHSSLYTNNQHITTYTDSTYVYSNSKSTVQWLTYDPELLNLYFLYSYSWNIGGDSLIPAVSASMNYSNNSVHVGGGHMGLANVTFDNNLEIGGST